MCMKREPVRFHSKLCLLSLVWRKKKTLSENLILLQFFFLQERCFDLFGMYFAVPEKYFADPERTAEPSLRAIELKRDIFFFLYQQLFSCLNRRDHRRCQELWLRGGGKPQITCNDVIINFQKRCILGGKNIVVWKIRSRGLVWRLTRFGI